MSDRTFRPGCVTHACATIAVAAVVMTVLNWQRSGPAGRPGVLVVAIPLGVLTAVLSLVGAAAFRRRLKLGQRRRERQAMRILDLVGRGRAPPYWLYLRPFKPTKQMVLSNPALSARSSLLSQRRYSPELSFDLEMILAAAVDPLPLIGIGNPGVKVGAGMLSSDNETWRERLKLLAAHCRGIVMIPSYRESTLWEMEWLLANRLIGMGVFCMPGGVASGPRIQWLVEWGKTRDALYDLGVYLPEFSGRTELFRLSTSGHPVCRREILRMDYASVRAALEIVASVDPEAQEAAEEAQAAWEILHPYRARLTVRRLLYWLLLAVVAVIAIRVLLMVVQITLSR